MLRRAPLNVEEMVKEEGKEDNIGSTRGPAFPGKQYTRDQCLRSYKFAVFKNLYRD